MSQWVRTIACQDLVEGTPQLWSHGSHELALYRVGESCYATDNACTHGFASLCDGFQEGHIIECPLHQGRFDVRNGECMSPPVTEPIRTYELRIVDGYVEVQLTE